MTDASRKAKERASRKAKGMKRIEAWINEEEAAILADLALANGGSQGDWLVNGFRLRIGLKPRLDQA